MSIRDAAERTPFEGEVLGDLQESMDVTRFGDTF